MSPSRNEQEAQAQAEAQVRSWGYTTVYTWTDAPYVPAHVTLPLTHPTHHPHHHNSNTHYPPHHHRGKTTHLILAGSLTMRYPREETDCGGVSEEDNKKKELGVGERWDVEAGRVHEVWVGGRGCRYVIGE